MARRQVSEGRKAVYYLGMILMVIGFLSFFSVFFAAPGPGTSFESFEAESRSAATRAVTGMGLMIAGGVLMGIGYRGAAGSGVILDPEKAREDMEPWNRMTGGMIKDGADEAGIDLGTIDRLGHNDNQDMPFDEKLRRLHQLKLDGILTEEEYEREKQKILDENR